MNSFKFSMLVLAAILTLPVFADVTDDAIKLAQSGVTEDVIVAWCEHQQVTNITAQDVLRMRDGKVPDRAIAAMLRSASRQMVPINTNNTEYVAPITTYVYRQPYYYDYPYYNSYGYPYYRSYGWGPSIGFGFNFGHGVGHSWHHR